MYVVAISLMMAHDDMLGDDDGDLCDVSLPPNNWDETNGTK